MEDLKQIFVLFIHSVLMLLYAYDVHFKSLKHSNLNQEETSKLVNLNGMYLTLRISNRWQRVFQERSASNPILTSTPFSCVAVIYLVIYSVLMVPYVMLNTFC